MKYNLAIKKNGMLTDNKIKSQGYVECKKPKQKSTVHTI